MAEITSPVNENAGETTDSILLTTSSSGLHKLAVAGTSTSISGSATNGAVQQVGTIQDDGAFTIAGSVVLVAGGLADETSPDSVSEGDAGAMRMTLARKQIVVSSADAAAITSVNSVDTSTSLIGANPNRIGLLVNNTDANALYLKYGTTASATSFTVIIPTNSYWEMPNPVYRGAIDGIWAVNGSGAAVITELT